MTAGGLSEFDIVNGNVEEVADLAPYGIALLGFPLLILAWEALCVSHYRNLRDWQLRVDDSASTSPLWFRPFAVMVGHI